jgi:hypothetical protein
MSNEATAQEVNGAANTIGTSDAAGSIEAGAKSVTAQLSEALSAAMGSGEAAAEKTVAAASKAADSGLQRAASTAGGLASTIRERGASAGGPVADVASAAADAFERGGVYLSETDARTLIERGQELIIRNRRLTIISAVLLAIVLLMIVVRLARGSSESPA